MEGRAEEAAAAAAVAGSAGGNPAAALLEALLALPDLSTPEDREQLAGITSLAAVLQVRQLSICSASAASSADSCSFRRAEFGLSNMGSGVGPHACTTCLVESFGDRRKDHVSCRSLRLPRTAPPCRAATLYRTSFGPSSLLR